MTRRGHMPTTTDLAIELSRLLHWSNIWMHATPFGLTIGITASNESWELRHSEAALLLHELRAIPQTPTVQRIERAMALLRSACSRGHQ